MANRYLVVYDLRKPGRNYDNLYRILRAYQGPGNGILESTWLISTGESAAQVRDKLKQHIDANDVLGVFGVSSQDWGTYNIDKSSMSWLN